MSWVDVAIQTGIWALEILVIAISIALSVAYIIYVERRVIGWMQVRKGCNRVGWAGLLQPIADGLKLFLKETIIPTTANKFLFVAAPVMAMAPATNRNLLPFRQASGRWRFWSSPYRLPCRLPISSTLNAV